MPNDADCQVRRPVVYRSVCSASCTQQLTLENVCTHCRPLRSKFDAETEHVVARFDHYCPWLNNAIGAGNYRSFVAFVATAFVSSLSFCMVVVSYMRVTTTGGEGAALSFLIRRNAWLSVFAAHYIFYAVFSGALLVQHVQLIAKNLTTNEALNWRRYAHMKGHDGLMSNPFDRGTWSNVVEFATLMPFHFVQYDRDRQGASV